MWLFFGFVLLALINLLLGKFHFALFFSGLSLIDIYISIKTSPPEKNEEPIVEKPEISDDEIKTFVKNSVTITGPDEPVLTTKKRKNTLDYIKARKLVDDYVVIDFETTGLKVEDNEIIQIGAIKYKDNQEIERLYQNIRPVRSEITKRITKITGLHPADVVDKPTFEEFSKDLVDFIEGKTLIAHNAPFDMKFLLYQLKESDLDLDYRLRVIDTLPLARRTFETENHKLATLKEFLNLENVSHDALEDCIVTNEVYQYIKSNP